MKTYLLRTLTLFFLVLLITASGGYAQFANCGMKAFTLSPASNVTSNSDDLNWNTAAAPTSAGPFYTANGGANSSAQTTFPFLTYTNLSPGTQYQVSIAAVKYCGSQNEQEQDVSSNIITILTKPTYPGSLSASNITTNSFTANWGFTTGTSTYTLDVADNVGFSSPTSYTTSQTSYNVSGLSPGTTYYFRVTATNASGTLGYGTAVSFNTQLAQPTLTAATAITTTGFSVNWNAVPASTGYQLDVSTNSNFTSYLPGFQNTTVAGALTKSVTGCSPGIVYYYRVRATNASSTSSAGTGSTITIPALPVARQATAISVGQFTANWSAVTGATGYKVDVATDGAFANIVPGFDAKDAAVTNVVVNGLQPSAYYFYRVKAIDASGSSVYSQTITVLTLPAPPTDISVLAKATELDASWLAIPNAIQYQLFVAGDQAFTDVVAGYGPKPIDAAVSNYAVTGLETTKVYYLRVRVVNETGTSDFSNIKVAQTTTATGPAPITISSDNTPANHLPGSSLTIQCSVSGGQAPLAVNFFHRHNAETAYTKEAVTVQGPNVSINVSDDWFDAFGMQFYVEATDQTGNTKRTSEPNAPQQINTAVQNISIPLSHFGKDVSNYRIISIPYAPHATKIQELFEKIMGAYNKSNWRLLQYYGEKNNDYTDGVSVSDMTQGQGYWFISKSPVDLSFGDGQTFGNAVNAPFVMKLKKGWTQIGNPFPYQLSWNSILAANNNPQGVGNLIGFDPSTIALTDNDTLKVYGGGFVFSENDIDITIPVTAPLFGGRKITASVSHDQATGRDWFIPIIASQGNVINSSGGIGMLNDALTGKDSNDKVTPPRFVRYVEFSSRIPGFDYRLAKNIVNTQDKFNWEYNIEADASDDVMLSWNKLSVSELEGQLILHDAKNGLLLDMASIGSYKLNSKSSITIHYDKTKSLTTDQVTFNVPFPNPFTNHVSIPLDYEDSGDPAAFVTSALIMNVAGQVVLDKKTLALSGQALQYFEWDGRDCNGNEVAAGVYTYKITVSKKGKIILLTGRIIRA